MENQYTNQLPPELINTLKTSDSDVATSYGNASYAMVGSQLDNSDESMFVNRPDEKWQRTIYNMGGKKI